MITPQDIREKTFEKAMFGGYDMGGIDEFLEEVANDVAALQKENAVLKGKMKVLVEKVDEYRRNEDTLNSAVLSAQRLGAMIEAEARERPPPSSQPQRQRLRSSPPLPPFRQRQKRSVWPTPSAPAPSSLRA